MRELVDFMRWYVRNLDCRDVLVLVSLTLLITMTVVSSARGRNLDGRYDNSPNKEWFEHLRSGKGPCCSDADGQTVMDSDWDTKDGHYRVRLDVSNEVGKVDMQWVDVPDDAVITEPNRVGRTIVWPIRGYLGVSVRCFMPGAEG